ncbi:PAS domain S-box protein [Sulfurimonas sp. HSL3-2]|uniref:PAS domain S-box protein n=1 Tax=Hydrocurvibacter mobilis TaxID=3131936 RepID=UPI0031F8CDBA
MNETVCERVGHAYEEWMSAIDSFEDAIFMHDKDFRILRCNKAYQKYAGIPFREIIGRKYFEVFPKTDAPLHSCAEAIETLTPKGHEEELLIDGRFLRSRSYCITDEHGEHLYSMHTLEDITEFKKMEMSLLESEEKFRSITASAQDAIIIMDDEGKISYWNPASEKIFGYSQKEVLGQVLHDLLTPKRFLEAHHIGFKHFKKTGEGPAIGKTVELSALKKDGTEFPIELSLSAVKREGRWNAIGFIRDITQRKKAEQKFRDTKMFSETLIQSLPGIFFLVDQNAGMIQWNRRLEELTGLSSEEILGVNAMTFMHEDDKAYAMQNLQKAFETGYASAEVRMLLTSGVRYYSITGYRLETQYGVNVIGIGMDITERRESQELLRKSEEKFRSLVESTNDWIWEIDKNGKYTYVSPQVEKLLGYKPEEIVGKTPFDLMPPSEVKKFVDMFQEYVEKRAPLISVENTNVHKDGHDVVLETSGTPFFEENGEFAGYRGIDRDITERKQSESSLKRLNRALRTLSAGNLALVRASSEDELIHEVTRVIVEKGEYSLAVVDYADNDETKRIIPKAWAGLQKRHFWIRNLSWADVQEGQLPVARAIRTGKTHISHDIAVDPAFKAWKEGALALGYVSNIALPLSDGEKTFGALCIYSSEIKSYDDEEVKLLEELASDLAYGIVNLRARAAHEEQALLLQESLEESIQAIAATLESRDPYTAGHQRRVSELATAIAREMNLSAKQIKGVEFAGVIHDLGKIHVPAEILSKPGRLNELEYKLIQMHPQTGYDILKNIKFPWPIADIILQHHEKIDGTGYPQGLIGDAILLEARIITVADVVEAISSHRPYRPAMGLSVAFEEIERGRGSAYDPDVVDACMNVFNKKGFTFNMEGM